ncbi:MAG: hypothetical protein ACM31E_07565 [Fibrobacterota bacterium]|nr:hypothetical protein [Chitinispirillaceae bacterium]
MADTTSVVAPTETTDKSKKTSDYERPEQTLERHRLSLTNANDPRILDILGRYNYSTTRINDGLALVKKATDMIAGQKKEKGEQLAASKVLDNRFTDALEQFKITRTIARSVFANDPNAYVALELNGEMKSSLSGFVKQAGTFYANILTNASFSSALAEYGFTEEKLLAEQALITGVLEANSMHKKERGEAIEATALRDAAFDDLDAWMSRFYTIVNASMKKQPELLRILGM